MTVNYRPVRESIDRAKDLLDMDTATSGATTEHLQAAATIALAEATLELARVNDQLVLETKRATHLRR